MDGSPLPIPLSEVFAYCEMFGVHGLDPRDKLLKMIRIMDSVLLEHAHKKRKEATQSRARKR